MSCEHAETTTLLWLYGEGPEDHAAHVAECAECTEVSALHADVVAVLPEVEAVPVRPANGSAWYLGGGLALAAAAVLVALVGGRPAEPTLDTAVALAPATTFEWQAPLSDLTDELDALDAEFADLSDELANL
ncbi:MAG: hypothetical protein EP330_23130 [Deltaproteobacteria bacterium]|nr:MAG: hypothetical protein EP330_23130 [Deltaproteobacteria bacterium]